MIKSHLIFIQDNKRLIGYDWCILSVFYFLLQFAQKNLSSPQRSLTAAEDLCAWKCYTKKFLLDTTKVCTWCDRGEKPGRNKIGPPTTKKPLPKAVGLGQQPPAENPP